MATPNNPKRARQKQNRQQKLARLQVEEQKAKKVNSRKRLLTWVGGIAAVILLVFGISRCGGDNDDATDTTVATDESVVVTDSTTPAPAITASPKLSSKPVVTVPAGDPPKTLQITDIEVGTGPEIAAGDSVSVQYVGVSWSTKKEFDTSWSPGRTPFDVTNVGQASVIAGWNEGLIGLREGGRRQLVIPPDKGYGATGTGADIGPNETLVFVIDAVKVTKAAAAAAPTASSVSPVASTPTSAAPASAAPTSTPVSPDTTVTAPTATPETTAAPGDQDAAATSVATDPTSTNTTDTTETTETTVAP